MRGLSVIGISKSGKTTTIENIIGELKRRNYSVGSIKEIHFHAFKMDIEGTNTDRHRKAGATLVTARGDHETDILFQEKLPLNEIFKFYNHDFVIMEGVRDTSAPKIIAAQDIEGIESRLDESVIAISGVISNEIKEYKGIPVINSLTNLKELVDLIEEKTFKLLPDVNDECCKACGYTCSELGVAIINGEASRDDCVLSSPAVILKINGNDIPMVPFVQSILKNTVEAIVGELDGYVDNGEIEVCIRR